MGIVSRLAPAILRINRINPTAGRIAYNALAGGVGIARRAAPIAGKLAKAVPVIGAGFTAYDAASGYNKATQEGDDPARAAFRGIGRTIGGFGGGIGGGAAGTFAGPVGTFAGGVGGSYAGSEAGDALGGSVYDFFNPNKGNQSLPASAQPMTIEEQRQRRQQIQARRATQQLQNPNTLDVGGFKYSQGVDPTLAAIRMQTQSNNIDAVQGYSRDKFQISNQARVALGQQSVDKYGIGQENQTARYGIGQQYMTERQRNALEAGAINRRTDSDTTLGLGQQYTNRYGIDANLNLGRDTNATQRAIAEAGFRRDLGVAGIQGGQMDKDRDLKRYQGDQDYKLKDKGQSLGYATSALQILGGFYR